MMSFKFKLQLSKESLARFSSMILIFLISFSLLLVKANSQSNEVSNNFGYALLIFSAVVIVLTILAITKNPVSDFLLKNYKVVIIALVILFILLYFIPQIPLKSITGLFVIPTTTTTTTTPEVKEEALTGLIQTFSEMQPGKVNSMKFSAEGVSLTELELEVYNKLNNVRIVVSKLSSKPISAMQYPSGNVYQYLEIEKTNIGDEDLKKVIIKFRVEKSWINSNEIDESTVSLNRYQDNTWFKLSTVKTDEDNEFIYYETVTGSLSLFAITGETPTQETTTTTTVVTTTTTITTTSIPVGKVTTISASYESTEPLPEEYDCDDINTICSLTTYTKTYPGGNTMTANYQKPINYLDESGNYQQINKTIIELPTDHSAYSYGYRYGTEKGIYKVYFKPDIGQNWEIALNISNIIIRYDLQRVGYLDYSDMSYQILQTPSTDSVVLANNTINHTGVFLGTDIQYSYLAEKLKEKIILNQTFRDNAPDPRNYGMNPATTYLITESELDYTDFRVFVNDTEQTENFTTENRVEFKDALGNIKFFLPVGYAIDSQVNDLGIPNNTQRVRWRIEHRAGKHYLLYGIPVLWLNSAQYPVTIDPTGEIPFTKEIDHYSLQNDLNEYYFNATDAQQMVNHFQDYWSKNEICIGFYINRWREYCTDAVDWTWYNSTDYSSYVNLTGVAEAFYGKNWYQKTSRYEVRVILEHYLESSSPEIKVSVKIQNIGNNNIQDTYIKVWTHDIRVNLTYDNDTFRVNTTHFWEVWSGWKQYLLDQSGLDLFYTENDLASRKYAIFDNSTESWVEMEWNDSYWKNGISNSMNYNLSVKKGSEVNAPVDLIFLTGSLNKNDVITTNFNWADAIKQNFTGANFTYQQIRDWIRSIKSEGIETHIQDWEMDITMRPDGKVNVKYNINVLNKNITSILAFHEIAWKHSCFQYPILNSVNTTRCPENETDEAEILYDFANREIISPKRENFSATESLPYLLVDNQSGILDRFVSHISPNTSELLMKSKVKLPFVFEVDEFKIYKDFDVDYGYTGTSHCIKFPIFENTNMTLNVTMLSPIANYTFGREEFITYNYTEGNSAIANIRVYPCCYSQEVEVCST